MGSLGHPLIIIGDIGVDLVLGPLSEWPRVGTETLMEHSELRAGGSGGNTALAVDYLGGASRLLSAVGHDDLGLWLAGQLKDLGAALDVCEAATTLTVGMLHACGERTFFTTRGHLESLSYESIRARLVPAPTPNAIALLTGAFLTPKLRAAYPRLIADLVGLGYWIALDTNWPPQNWNPSLRAEVAGWIAACDHVLLNEMEVSSLTDVAEPALAIERLSAMLKPGATLVVKRGARGAIGVQPPHHCCAEAPQAEIFDTIGAGDSFNAGYLLARLRGANLAAALAAGCRSASAIIARFPRRSIARGELRGRLALQATPMEVP